MIDPLLILALGIATVVVLILVLRTNAFLALITAAMLVSLLAPGQVSEKLERVAIEFGVTSGKIGIVIALAAIIGQCMMDSGAADRIVRAFLRVSGERRASWALAGSGYVLSVPVFFDTVFYLLVPLARSLAKRTGKDFLKYIMAIAAGGVATHTLVPPTPGPLTMAANLNVDLGTMILVGVLIAIPTSIAGAAAGAFINRRMPIPLRPISSEPEPPPLDDAQLPSLWWSLVPIVLPVALIASNTAATTLADAAGAPVLSASDLGDIQAFATKLQSDAQREPSGLAARMVARFDLATREQLVQRTSTQLAASQIAGDPAASEQLAAALNRLVADRDLSTPAQRALAEQPKFVRQLADRGGPSLGRLSEHQVRTLNHGLLSSAYPNHVPQSTLRAVANWTMLVGDPNFALFASAIAAMTMLVRTRNLTVRGLAKVVEFSLMSGGVIILITAAGGAFGGMLRVAQVGDRIKDLFGGESAGGLTLILLAFAVSAVLKIAQGSGTVVMVTASGMFAAMIPPEGLGFHPVYLATAIGGGSVIISWMNDSGFWVVSKMSGMTEAETLKSWTVVLAVLGVTTLLMTLLLVQVMPLA